MNRLFRVILLLSLVLNISSCIRSGQSVRDAAALHYKFGTTFLRTSKIPSALKELNYAVEQEPDNARYHNALGLAYFAKGLNKEAIVHFRKAIDINRHFSEARVNLSAVYLKVGLWNDAINEATKAVEDIYYPSPQFAYLNRARGLYEKKEFSQAIKDLKKAIVLSPDYALARYNLALTYMAVRKYDYARNEFIKVLKIDPDNVSAIFNLGVIYMESGEYKMAINMFREVIKKAPDSSFVTRSRNYIRGLE